MKSPSAPHRDRQAVLRRWIAFNVVGATGVGAQLAAMAGLLLLGVHYLAATALAVEVAVLNNFVWHERWTWRDRKRGGTGGGLQRLIRFNITVGVVSIAENLVLMELLVNALGCDYLTGNVLSIALCSLLNFALADRLVFRRAHTATAGASRMRRIP